MIGYPDKAIRPLVYVSVNISDIVLIFSLVKTVFFLSFCFIVYKMVDSEYRMYIYKSVKVSIGTVMKNLEILNFFSHHLKT